MKALLFLVQGVGKPELSPWKLAILLLISLILCLLAFAVFDSLYIGQVSLCSCSEVLDGFNFSVLGSILLRRAGKLGITPAASCISAVSSLGALCVCVFVCMCMYACDLVRTVGLGIFKILN